MEFVSLASSSKGNCYILNDSRTRIMLEAGLSEREIKKRMHAAGAGNLADISAVLISHEHKDHSKSAVKLLDDGISVYASEGTAAGIGDDRIEAVKSKELFKIGTFDILPFDTFHNTPEPLGFLIQSRFTGERMLFAIDTVNLVYIIPGLDYIAIECNYVKSELERHTKLNEKVREHIKNTHLELGMLLKYLKKLDLSKVKKVYLMHLSTSNSSESKILQAFSSEFPALDVEICSA